MNLLVFPCLLVSIFICFIAKDAYANEIYFTNSNDPAYIRSIHDDGSQLHTILPLTPGAGRGIKVNPNDNRIYYQSSDGFFRANLDGSNVERLRQSAIGFDFDFVFEKIYYTTGNQVNRMNLDGSGDEIVIDLVGPCCWDFFRGIAVDSVNNHLYLTGIDASASPFIDDGGFILRANLDGSNLETVAQIYTENFGFPISTLADIEIDVAQGKIYWTDQFSNGIFRSNLDGSGTEKLINSWGRTLALDFFNGKIYWGNPWSGINVSNLDGSGQVLLLPNNWDVYGIAVANLRATPVPEPPSIFLISIGFGLVVVAELGRKIIAKK